jgi:O-antigen biosynthesis protein
MTYLEWLDRFASLNSERRADLREKVFADPHAPLISVILPVHNSDLGLLTEAIASVRRQIYDNWEICIADDASKIPQVRRFLANLPREDRRIKVFFREQNGHISACSNSALSLARGEWCALLDQDDMLAEDALAEVACEIARHPDAGIIYSDEDFLDAKGVRFNPFFKPDWNPELFLAQNYLNHLGVYRTSLLREIGGFREGFEGSQDYDLALRCVSRLGAAQIRHIPRLLYHWRMVEGSLADQPDAKPYARHAARRALNSYLAERGIAAEATACPENDESHRVIYALPARRQTVTAIVTHNNQQFVGGRDYLDLEMLHTERGAAAANAQAQQAKGEILLFLRGEICAADPGWLREIVSHIVRPEVGAVGARLWSPQGHLLDGALILGLDGIAAPAFGGLPRGHPGYFNRAWLQQNLSAVSAACLAVRRDVFQVLGGFDAAHLPYHFYAVDFCLRLRDLKLQVVWTPYANLTLIDSTEGNTAPSLDEASYMQERWGPELIHDPSYNPNLSLDLPGFTLAIPSPVGH